MSRNSSELPQTNGNHLDDSYLQSPIRIYSAESQLFSPKKFLISAWQDLRFSSAFAKCLFWQNIARHYRYSSLGVLWAFVPSALIAIALTLGQRSGVSVLIGGTVPPQIYGIFGMIMAQTFLEAVNIQRVSFNQHIHLLTRQKIPVESLMLAGIAESIFGFIMRFPVLIAILLIFNITPSLTAPLALLGIAIIIGLGSGLGLFLGPWNALSRDLDNVMQFFPWFVFFVTPIFIVIPPGNWLYSVQLLNPLTYVFEATRLVTYDNSLTSCLTLLLFIPFTILLLIGGWLFCRLCLPYVIERSIT